MSQIVQMRVREQECTNTRCSRCPVHVSSQQNETGYRAGGENRRDHSAGFDTGCSLSGGRLIQLATRVV
jgi:hypothetical protein